MLPALTLMAALALAPPAIWFIMGVSTSRKPRFSSASRSARTTLIRVSALRRAVSRMMRSV